MSYGTLGPHFYRINNGIYSLSYDLNGSYHEISKQEFEARRDFYREMNEATMRVFDSLPKLLNATLTDTGVIHSTWFKAMPARGYMNRIFVVKRGLGEWKEVPIESFHF